MSLDAPKDPEGLLTASPALTAAWTAITEAATVSKGRFRLDPEEGKLALLDQQELAKTLSPPAMYDLDRAGWLDTLMGVYAFSGKWEAWLQGAAQTPAIRQALGRLAAARKGLEAVMAELGGAG